MLSDDTRCPMTIALFVLSRQLCSC